MTGGVTGRGVAPSITAVAPQPLGSISELPWITANVLFDPGATARETAKSQLRVPPGTFPFCAPMPSGMSRSGASAGSAYRCTDEAWRSGLCRQGAITIMRDESSRRKMLRRDFLALTGAGLRATAFVPTFHGPSSFLL